MSKKFEGWSANLIRKYHIQANQALGQNFLMSDVVTRAIVQSASLSNTNVVEIGPGLGALTIQALPLCQTLHAYEVDIKMIQILQQEIKDPKLSIHPTSFLNCRFDFLPPKVVVIGNIPYNRTSEILFHLLTYSHMLESATIMVQKEVGERLIALPNTSNYGKLTVAVWHFATVSSVLIVKADQFVPAPKVDSMVIKIVFHTHCDFEESKPFLDFVKDCFAMRRKTLVNNLKQNHSLVKVNQVLVSHGINLNARPQELSVEQFQNLFKALN